MAIPGAERQRRYIQRLRDNIKMKYMFCFLFIAVGNRLHKISANYNKEEVQTAKMGKPFPQFNVTIDIEGQSKVVCSLQDFKGKYVVIVYYFLVATSECPTEIMDLFKRADEFNKIGSKVIAITTLFQPTSCFNNTIKGGNLGFPCPVMIDEFKLLPRYCGIPNAEIRTPYKAVFIIDDKHILRQIIFNDLNVGQSVDLTLRLVQAFQVADNRRPTSNDEL